MTQKNLSELTDEELLQLAKNRKSTDLMNAVIIGFAIGIVAYSFLKNTLGLLTLLPLLFAIQIGEQVKPRPQRTGSGIKGTQPGVIRRYVAVNV